jgi:DNA-binding helix-hairpin-helix protein with protein kinase domain
VEISKATIKEFSEAQYDRARVPLSQWPLLTIIGRNLLGAYGRLIEPSTKIL